MDIKLETQQEPETKEISDSSTTGENKNIFTRKNILALQDKIRLVDSDEDSGLDLFCYTNCTNLEDDYVKQCRGLVFHGEKLILKAFSYPDEYNHTEVEALGKVFQDCGSWNFFQAYEGALLRLFYFSGKWVLSTHRKLSAFRSKWASRESFGTLFKKALEKECSMNNAFEKTLGEGENILDKFQASLDKEKQYMFLICHNAENRIVCHPPELDWAWVYHVGTFVDGKLRTDVDLKLPCPQKIDIQSVEQLVDYVDREVDPMELQGVVCFGEDGKQVKVLHSRYQELSRARGNEPSIKFRYLQVRMNRELTRLLYGLYPQMAPVFEDYENTLYDVACIIYNAYVQRFIKKNYVTVPREDFQVITECHKWHLSDREKNRVSVDRIIKSLNLQPATSLNRMIRRYKTEQLKKQGGVAQQNSSKVSQKSPVVAGQEIPGRLLHPKPVEPEKTTV